MPEKGSPYAGNVPAPPCLPSQQEKPGLTRKDVEKGDLKDGEETDVGTRAEAWRQLKYLARGGRKGGGAGQSTISSGQDTPLRPPSLDPFPLPPSLSSPSVLCSRLTSFFITVRHILQGTHFARL